MPDFEDEDNKAVPIIMLDEARRRGRAEDARSEPADIPVVYPFPINGVRLPRRPWLVPGLLLRRQVTLLVAPPGSGKSLLTLQLALVCSSAMTSWNGWRPRQRCKVMIINVEEDEDEMRRRLYAAADVMELTESDLSGICIARTDIGSIVIARADARTKTVIATPMLERIVQTVNDLGVDIVIVDPFAETFAGDENSNSELKWAAVLWREVARRTNTSLMLVHHAKKYSQNMAGDMDAGRGGGALAGVARIVATLFTMTPEEATAFNIKVEDRNRFIRFDDAKANLSLVSASAKWFRKQSYTLPNEGDGEPADEVGVLVPWQAPDAFAGMSIEVANAILDELKIGVRNEQGEPSGDPFGPMKSGGSERWAGQVVQQKMQCTEQNAKKLLKAWIENGVLEVMSQKTSTSKGKLRDCVVVIDARRPGSASND